MSGELQITVCPSCGSGRIEQVVRDVARRHEGREYVVPAVAFYECPDCGEKMYDREAMLKIEACSPAYKQSRSVVRGRKRGAAEGKRQEKAAQKKGAV
jgi:YgiT-type zinc finger domain-containing protein